MTCVIFNHNNNDSSYKLMEMFSEDMNTYVLDAGSTVLDPSFISYDNIHYSALFNEAVKLANKNNSGRLLIITGDVMISEENYYRLISNISDLDDDIGCYSPSAASYSKAHYHMKTKESGLRDVPFCEGFFSLIKREVFEKIFPIDSTVNRYGWGIDVYTGYQTIKCGLRCVVDDDVIIYHPNGCGYSQQDASMDMYKWADSMEEDFKKYLFECLK